MHQAGAKADLQLGLQIEDEQGCFKGLLRTVN
jgi:hypothetical protein